MEPLTARLSRCSKLLLLVFHYLDKSTRADSREEKKKDRTQVYGTQEQCPCWSKCTFGEIKGTSFSSWARLSVIHL